MTAVINARSTTVGAAAGATEGRRSEAALVQRVEGHSDRVNAAVLLSREDGLLSVSDDRSIRLYLKRDSGQYWPSICHYASSRCLSLELSEETGRLFVGLETGVVSEFALADDFNSITAKRDFCHHQNGVTALHFALDADWLLSVAKDKHLVWQCSETGRKLGSVNLEAWCTCMVFDSAAKIAFVGDYTGTVSVVRLKDAANEPATVTKLSAHTGSIQSLAWDAERQLLFSCSNDQLVIIWDVGGKKGSAYELNGHRSKVQALAYATGAKRLFSAGGNGELVVWDTQAERVETPGWMSADSCTRCQAPFFWNWRECWQRKTVGTRQHHCRLCGKAVCDACSKQETVYPRMGYELPVRICDGCQHDIDEPPFPALAASSSADATDLKPLALMQELKHSVVAMHLIETRGRLLTVGSDKIIRLWDVSSLLRA